MNEWKRLGSGELAACEDMAADNKWPVSGVDGAGPLL